MAAAEEDKEEARTPSRPPTVHGTSVGSAFGGVSSSTMVALTVDVLRPALLVPVATSRTALPAGCGGIGTMAATAAGSSTVGTPRVPRSRSDVSRHRTYAREQAPSKENRESWGAAEPTEASRRRRRKSWSASLGAVPLVVMGLHGSVGIGDGGGAALS